jgi:hypothetical protein
LDPLTTDPALWCALISTYVATVEARHSLVHRPAEVDRSTGTFTGRDMHGQPSDRSPPSNRRRPCRAIQRDVSAVLAGEISPRECADVAWQLDQLQGHHQ